MQLVALSGNAGTGKDYLYEHYLKPLGFYRVALADHFKNFVVGKGLATFEEVHITKPPHIRKLLQEEGTERGRNLYGDRVWCDTLVAWMKHWERTWGITKFAMTDVRFPNEADFVHELGGRVYRIVAPNRYANNGMSPEARLHPSETAMDGFTNYDGILHNDYGNEFSVGPALTGLLHAHGVLTASDALPTTILTGA